MNVLGMRIKRICLCIKIINQGILECHGIKKKISGSQIFVEKVVAKGWALLILKKKLSQRERERKDAYKNEVLLEE